MPFLNFHILIIATVYFASAEIIEKNSENYGPYTLEMEKIYMCRGPKVANLTSYTVNLMKEVNSFKGAVNMTFLDQTKIEDVKMSVFTMKGDRKILLWNYKVNQPCQHYAMSKVFETYVKSKNCVVQKGTYICSLNLSQITETYLGSSFFYGEFIFKVIVLSKKGNIACFVFHPIFKRKCDI